MDKPLWQFTLGEFLDAMKNQQIQSQQNVEQADYTGEEYVYGIEGLAKLLGCSEPHAWKKKKEGIFDEAIIQNGRKIIVNRKKALELFGKNKYIKK